MKVVRSRDQSVSRVTDETLSLLGYLVGLGVLVLGWFCVRNRTPGSFMGGSLRGTDYRYLVYLCRTLLCDVRSIVVIGLLFSSSQY